MMVSVHARQGEACRHWRVVAVARASGGTVEAPTRPQTKRRIILGDDAPARHV